MKLFYDILKVASYFITLIIMNIITFYQEVTKCIHTILKTQKQA